MILSVFKFDFYDFYGDLKNGIPLVKNCFLVSLHVFSCKNDKMFFFVSFNIPDLGSTRVAIGIGILS